MKSCQTEDLFTEMILERKHDNYVEVSVQTLDETPRNIVNDIQISNENDLGEHTDEGKKLCSNCHKLQQHTSLETVDTSIQTEIEEVIVDHASLCNTEMQGLKSSHQMSTVGVQNVPEIGTKISQTLNRTQSHHAQTDMTSDNCEIALKRSVADSGCQAFFVGRVASVQTDNIELPTDDQSINRNNSQKLNATEVTSALEPALQNFSQDVRLLVTEAVESHQNSLRDLMNKCIASEVKNLKDDMEDSLQQKSAQQSQETELKFSELTHHLNEVLQGQVDSLTEVCNKAATTENSNLANVLSQVNNNLETKFQDMRQEIGEIHNSVGSNEGRIVSHIQDVAKDVKESNDKVLKNLSDIQRESAVSSNEVCDKFTELTMPQFSGIQKAIENLNPSEDSGLSEDCTRGIVTRLDSLEKSLMISLEKSNVSQDLSSLDDELHRINDSLNKKLSALQLSIQSASSSGGMIEDTLESYIDKIKENNKQLLHALKTKTSESTTNINEALEENFHILQDHLRKVQQSMVQRINEVSQQVSATEDQKMSWLARQITEMASQVSGMQTNLLRVQSSLEAAQSLPSTGGALDETLISSLRTSNEQAVASLKFQNQSMIKLLESLQSEIHNSTQKPQSSSKDKAEIHHLRESLVEKEEELAKLYSSQESLQEKLRGQVFIHLIFITVALAEIHDG